MRTLIVCAAAALALAACQKPAEDASAADEAAAAADSATDASATAGTAGSGSSAATAGSGAAAGSGMEAVESGGPDMNMVEPSTGGPTQGARDNAQMKAEETNLHPRNPT